MSRWGGLSAAEEKPGNSHKWRVLSIPIAEYSFENFRLMVWAPLNTKHYVSWKGTPSLRSHANVSPEEGCL